MTHPESQDTNAWGRGGFRVLREAETDKNSETEAMTSAALCFQINNTEHSSKKTEVWAGESFRGLLAQQAGSPGFDGSHHSKLDMAAHNYSQSRGRKTRSSKPLLVT